MAVLAGLGVGAAIWYSEGGPGGSEAYALRVTNGVTETGEIVTVTTPSGQVKRLIKWRTATGPEYTDTIVKGTTVYGPGDTVQLPGGTRTVLGPGQTLTLTQTFTQPITEIQTATEIHENTVTNVVTQTVTETIRDTVTVVETVVNTVTETVVVTGTVPAPTP